MLKNIPRRTTIIEEERQGLVWLLDDSFHYERIIDFRCGSTNLKANDGSRHHRQPYQRQRRFSSRETRVEESDARNHQQHERSRYTHPRQIAGLANALLCQCEFCRNQPTNRRTDGATVRARADAYLIPNIQILRQGVTSCSRV
jgi:hypothetical protein